MRTMQIPTIFLPDPIQLELEHVHVHENDRRVILTVTSTQATAQCPLCHAVAEQIHSHYERNVGDLPWGGMAVVLHLQVRRFFCRNATCQRKIFSERLPRVVTPWGRRTKRLTAVQQELGLVAGGTGGAKLSQKLAMTVNTDTILRQVRQKKLLTSTTPRVLGVDDWALRKGHTYGTILIDLERSEVIDILPDRNAETLAQWLRGHPGVEIISRDRAEAYAEGAESGAPSATQVADRWHLLKNLSEALLKVLYQHHQLIENLLASMLCSETETAATSTQPAETLKVVQTEAIQAASAPLHSDSVQRRTQRVEQVQQLYPQGWSKRAISKHLNLDPKTIRRYLLLAFPLLPQRRQRRSMLDPFNPYILERWQAGCHNAAQLFRELQTQNYSGRSSTVRHYVQQLRQQTHFSSGPPSSQQAANAVLRRPPTLRTVLWSILAKPETLSDDEQRVVDQLIAAHPKLATTIRLAQDFAVLVRQRQADRLQAWLDQAIQSGSTPFQNFAHSLRRDHPAVSAALSLPWSNGPTEGHINRLKALKRQMYGRAKFDLLRLRLLANGSSN